MVYGTPSGINRVLLLLHLSKSNMAFSVSGRVNSFGECTMLLMIHFSTLNH